MNRMSYIVDTVELRKLLIDKNIDSISAFAELSGVGRDTVSGVLKGEIRPSTAVMDKFIAALELEPAAAGSIFLSPTYGMRKFSKVKHYAGVQIQQCNNQDSWFGESGTS